jgi:hypothetical protein
MKNQTRRFGVDCMLEFLFKAVSHFLTTLIASLVSLLKVLVRGHFGVKLPAPQRPICSILGNGPSLTESLREHTDFLKTTETVAVNNIASSSAYAAIQPHNYVLLDPAFFLYHPQHKGDRDDIRRTLESILTQTTWPMSLYVPHQARRSYLIGQLREQNSLVTPVYFNYTVVRGFRWLRHWLYRTGLGMPQSENVLVASLCLMLNRRFETIYLFGADHSWHEEIRLGSANELLMRQPHFYDNPQDVPLIPVYDVVKNEYSRMSSQFLALHKAFLGYEVLRDYAQSLGVQVFNASAKSYVDAFPRVKLRTNTNQHA